MIKTENYVINAAQLGKNNPLPDLKNVSYIHAGYELTDKITAEERKNIGKGMISTMLPYMLQDGYNRVRAPRGFKAVCLENDYLKAIFLPELGGRLWSLYDKVAQKELLYKNSVFQPANLALRNAWFSGGVEFNVGIKGHNPLTCSPIFAEILEYKDGTQVLKMYEYERIREVTYSISAVLPKDSPLLFIEDKIENTSDDEKFTYWWSNIAVPESKNTRIIVPADSTFLSTYNEGQYLVDKVPVPVYENKDLSYPVNSIRSQDFFYDVPLEEAKWIAAVNEDGYGLIQISQAKMIGRKLFVWGQGNGGRNWGEWLSEKGQSYIEIQAGLAKTQLEHIPLMPHETIRWIEAYGAVDCDKNKVHNSDWNVAQKAVNDAFCINLTSEEIENKLANVFPSDDDMVSRKTVHYGSGWGALENAIREKNNTSKVSDYCEFPVQSMNEEQEPWVSLLEKGRFPTISVEAEPISYVSERSWRPLLEKAAEITDEQQWYALYQLGVHYYIYNEIDNARTAWERSLMACESSWSMRNLALLYKNEYKDIEKAIEYISKAVKLNKTCRALLIDCAKLYTDNNLDEQWIDLYNTISDSLQADGRIRLFKAIAHMHLGQIEEASSIINEKFEMCDIQEGEVSLSHIWHQLYKMKLKKDTNISDESQLDKMTNEIYPLPQWLDFRMHE